MKSLPVIIVLTGLLLKPNCLGNSGIPFTGIVSQKSGPVCNPYIRQVVEKDSSLNLNYPKSVRRLYLDNAYDCYWMNGLQSAERLQQIKTLLDRSMEFGLPPTAYHPADLESRRLRTLLPDTSRQAMLSKARADVLLTDAVFTFITQLHFGNLNPDITPYRVETKDLSGFRPDSAFRQLFDSDIKKVVLAAQPASLRYLALQKYLQTELRRAGADSLNARLKLVAINLERYKWLQSQDSLLVEVNIPSYTLDFRRGERLDVFKVIVGKPSNRSPTLVSKINYLNTAPDWNVPPGIFARELLPKISRDPGYASRNNFAVYNDKGKYVSLTRQNISRMRSNPSGYFARQSYGCDNALGQIVFHFDNPYNVYLHDTPVRSLFNQDYRALSHGCIRLENPKLFASLLLEAISAPPEIFERLSNCMDNYQKFRYTLPRPVPIIIRYTTCSVENNKLTVYPDLYNRDQALIQKFWLQGPQGDDYQNSN